MKDGKSGALILALGGAPKLKPKGGMGMDDGMDEGPSHGASAMEDMFRACQKGDFGGAYDALCDAIAIHGSGGSSEKPDEEGEEY